MERRRKEKECNGNGTPAHNPCRNSICLSFPEKQKKRRVDRRSLLTFIPALLTHTREDGKAMVPVTSLPLLRLLRMKRETEKDESMDKTMIKTWK